MASRKHYFFLILLLTAGIFLYRSTTSTLGFSNDKISSNLPIHPEWEIPIPEEMPQIKEILNSRFTFLGEGAQAYAFESPDGKYVLKFFKMRRFSPSTLDYLCPHVVRRRLKNLRWVFNGYKIAYDHFKKDTGLVLIHLAKTNYLNQTAVIVDDKGKEYHIDLDRTEFVLQEKAELLFDRLTKLYKAGDQQAAQQSITAILDLVKRRIDKGYADRDKGVTNNYGFVGDRPIQLDIGRLYPGVKEGQLEHVQRRIERWQDEHQSLIKEYSN